MEIIDLEPKERVNQRETFAHLSFFFGFFTLFLAVYLIYKTPILVPPGLRISPFFLWGRYLALIVYLCGIVSSVLSIVTRERRTLIRVIGLILNGVLLVVVIGSMIFAFVSNNLLL